jgi:hypothetical protein
MQSFLFIFNSSCSIVHLSYSDILIPNFACISPSFELLVLVLQDSSSGPVTGATLLDSSG